MLEIELKTSILKNFLSCFPPPKVIEYGDGDYRVTWTCGENAVTVLVKEKMCALAVYTPNKRCWRMLTFEMCRDRLANVKSVHDEELIQLCAP